MRGENTMSDILEKFAGEFKGLEDFTPVERDVIRVVCRVCACRAIQIKKVLCCSSPENGRVLKFERSDKGIIMVNSTQVEKQGQSLPVLEERIRGDLVGEIYESMKGV